MKLSEMVGKVVASCRRIANDEVEIIFTDGTWFVFSATNSKVTNPGKIHVTHMIGIHKQPTPFPTRMYQDVEVISNGDSIIDVA